MRRSNTFALCLLAFCLAVLSTGLAFSQTAPVAYVYVGTSKGVDLYGAASNGKLTLISGSPFSITGSAAGSNGKYFLSLGTDYVHSYPVASNGAIKGQVSQINTQLYSGADCGTTSGAVLDHTGQHLLVMLGGQSSSQVLNGCVAFQTFDVVGSSGALIFNDATETDNVRPRTFTMPTIMANGAYAFGRGIWDEYGERTLFDGFFRESSGALIQTDTFEETDPQSQNGDWEEHPLLTAADPANHMAVAVYAFFLPSLGPHTLPVYGSIQLATYTVDSAGNLGSTNTWQNMPVPDVHPTLMNISPSGKLLAVAGGGNGDEPITNWVSTGTNGLEIFHFNGADPITPYSKTLTTDSIDQIHWDNNDHLYALSESSKKLYVYTITPTSISAAPGSPYTISSSPNALVVVPILCSAPASPGVHICSPASGAAVSSPVQVEAASTVTGTIARMQLWVDGVAKYTASSSTTLSTSISLAAGSHRFAVTATNTDGQKWENAVNATVAAGGTCSAPSSPGVHICSPASGATVSSLVQVEAASAVTGTIATMQLWVDGVKKYSASSSKTLSTSISLAAGSHRFAVTATNTAGQKWESVVYSTVQ